MLSAAGGTNTAKLPKIHLREVIWGGGLSRTLANEHERMFANIYVREQAEQERQILANTNEREFANTFANIRERIREFLSEHGSLLGLEF